MPYWWEVVKPLPGNPMSVGTHFHVSHVPADEMAKWESEGLVKPVSGVIGPVYMGADSIRNTGGQEDQGDEE